MLQRTSDFLASRSTLPLPNRSISPTLLSSQPIETLPRLRAQPNFRIHIPSAYERAACVTCTVQTACLNRDQFTQRAINEFLLLYLFLRARAILDIMIIILLIFLRDYATNNR
ncbi:hypothetical protein GQ42DRAFT_5865 [Ramicandelaber brevisporus]|nr:hypothetical protein GQ42DRAFT_5865 [Ramicandelaber brevisporus]